MAVKKTFLLKKVLYTLAGYLTSATCKNMFSYGLFTYFHGTRTFPADFYCHALEVIISHFVHGKVDLHLFTPMQVMLMICSRMQYCDIGEESTIAS